MTENLEDDEEVLSLGDYDCESQQAPEESASASALPMSDPKTPLPVAAPPLAALSAAPGSTATQRTSQAAAAGQGRHPRPRAGRLQWQHLQRQCVPWQRLP